MQSNKNRQVGFFFCWLTLSEIQIWLCFIENMKVCWAKYVSDVMHLSTVEAHFNHHVQQFKGYLRHVYSSLLPLGHIHTTRYMEKFPKPLFKCLSGRCTVGRLLWGWRASPGGQEPMFLPLVVMTDSVVASQACMCSASPLGVYLQIKRKRQQMLSHYFTRNWMTRSRKRKGRKELFQKERVPQWPGLS